MSGCGCCACLAGAGQPAGIYNRPGLSAIRYRGGTYSTIFDAMIRRLTVPIRSEQDEPRYSLHALTTREHDDPAIAMLDAWAISADVLTFYQERIANEGYLRTATERRSLLELGNLVGYTLKPGVSASTYLAYTIAEGTRTVIPALSKAQSIPGADEQPQMFETAEEIAARGEWNALRPRMRRPQRITVDLTGRRRNAKGELEEALIDNILTTASVWIDGTSTLFQKRDRLLFVFNGPVLTDPKPVYAIRRVLRTVADTELDRTEIVLEPVHAYYTDLYLAALLEAKAGGNGGLQFSQNGGCTPVSRAQNSKKPKAAKASQPADRGAIFALLREILLGTSRTVLSKRFDCSGGLETLFNADDSGGPVAAPVPGSFDAVLEPLLASPALAPRSQFEFARSLDAALGERSDTNLRLFTAFHPQLGTSLHTALANVTTGQQEYDQFRQLFVLRREAAVFGYNAPAVLFQTPHDPHLPFPEPVTEDSKVLYLDSADEKITAGSYAVIRNQCGTRVATIVDADVVPRAAYGISNRTSRLELDAAWADRLRAMPDKPEDDLEALRENLDAIRETSVSVETEPLTLAQQPVDRPVGRKAEEGDTAGESQTRIELDSIVDGLTPGRWIAVRGERLLGGTSGVLGAEVAMIENVEQQTDAGPGGTPYSILVLAPDGLAYEYERGTTEILANVVPAHHRDTHAEILGSGSASQPMQTFALHGKPLTFLPSPTVDGVRSTLAIRVDESLWQETTSLAMAGPNDRVYTTKTADDGKVTATFGDGIHGRRIPTGADNVRAVYATGIGRAGNVKAGQIATAITRPLNVTDVVNPTPSEGGGDPEQVSDARRNIPVSLQAMGRVVSVEDFANFARTFAGIAKATARLLSAGRMRFVHLTIGGADDITISPTSDLHRNLVASLRRYGDPYQPFVVALREKIVITGAARVRITPDRLWSLVAPNIRAALLDTFSYDRREFGQPVFASEVIAAIQNVPGVEYVDLDELRGVRDANVRAVLSGSASTPLESTTAVRVAKAIFTTGSAATEVGAPSIDCDQGRTILPSFAHLPKNTEPLLQHFVAAEIAYLPPELADLFIVTEIKE